MTGSRISFETTIDRGAAAGRAVIQILQKAGGTMRPTVAVNVRKNGQAIQGTLDRSPRAIGIPAFGTVVLMPGDALEYELTTEAETISARLWMLITVEKGHQGRVIAPVELPHGRHAPGRLGRLAPRWRYAHVSDLPAL